MLTTHLVVQSFFNGASTYVVPNPGNFGGYHSIGPFAHLTGFSPVATEAEQQTPAGRETFILPNGMRFRGTYADAQALWSQANIGETVQPVEARLPTTSKAAPVILKAVEIHENAENEQPRRTYYDALALLLLEA